MISSDEKKQVFFGKKGFFQMGFGKMGFYLIRIKLVFCRLNGFRRNGTTRHRVSHRDLHRVISPVIIEIDKFWFFF